MATNNIGDGDVELKLDGKTVTLKPTLRAALAISRQLGGVNEAHKKLVNLDIEAICLIVAAAMSVTGEKVDELGDQVWRTGASSFIAPLSKYLGRLINPSGASGEPGGENPPK